jgi:hypothetical protein
VNGADESIHESRAEALSASAPLVIYEKRRDGGLFVLELDPAAILGWRIH